MKKSYFIKTAVILLSVTVMAAVLSGCSSKKELDPFDYIELGQYKGLDIKKQVHEVTDEEMQDELDTLAAAYADSDGTPEITDDFINEISGGNIKTVEEYKEKLREQIISEYDGLNELQYYKDLWDTAVDNATLIKDIPEDLINEKVSRMVVNSQQYADSYGLSFDDFVQQYMGLTTEEFNTQAADYAVQAAKESLVLKAIAQTEGISVSDEELDKAIDEYTELGNYDSREDFLEQTSLDDLKEYVLQSKVEDFLAENAAK